ncbi:GPI anchored cell wall protein [Xylaria sp. CBS 124048]|nr:GPI anchored cell wall protein [Xylaria sp. CBS 124048]
MRYIAAFIPLLLTAASAAPYELISKRELTRHEWRRSKKDGCPAYLTDGEFESPSYITQISAKHPDKAFGPQDKARFTPNDISTIFSFDIPTERADANCTLEFLFPRNDQYGGPKYTYKGPGTFFFTGYNAGSCPGPETTFNNQPQLAPFPPFPPIHMEPGYAYTIDVGPCSFSAGKCAAGFTSTNDTHFAFTPDSDVCPIGIYTAYSYGLPCEPPYC